MFFPGDERSGVFFVDKPVAFSCAWAFVRFLVFCAKGFCFLAFYSVAASPAGGSLSLLLQRK
jgi:hypothetical protein